MSNKTKIKNIIFDFGGVLSVLDINISRRRFIELGVTNIDDYLDITAQKGFFGQLEDGSLSADEFCSYAIDKYRLATVPGTAFGHNGEGYVRLSYASSMEVLQKAVSLLQKIDQEL